MYIKKDFIRDLMLVLGNFTFREMEKKIRA